MKMTLCLALVLAFLSLQAANGAFLPTTQQPSQEQQQQQQQEPVATFVGHQVLRFSISTESERNQLIDAVRRLGLDLWAEHPEWMDVQVPPALLPEIQGLGLRHRVLIEDVQTRINLERFSIKAQAPASEAFFNAFRTLDEFNAFLGSLVQKYPQLATKFTIGKTLEGREINGILITAKNNNKKVGIVYNGGQHAREWISPMTNAWIANQLLTLYGSDSQITEFVNRFEWSIIPIVNADGYVYTWSTNRMWRKNRRRNGDNWLGCYGVDVNRNWDFKWGEGGSSPNTCAEDYMGPSPFSEPEETLLANYIKSRGNVLGYIDFHSYSQLWMTPWGYTNSLPSDYTDLLAAAKACVDALSAVHGTKYQYGSISRTIYPASGSSVDWTYSAVNATYSFAVELRDTGRYGFILPPSEIVPTGEETFAAVRAMGNYILKKL